MKKELYVAATEQQPETITYVDNLDGTTTISTNLTQDLNQNTLKNNHLIVYGDLISDKAIFPSKRREDAGFDIYTIEDECVLKPGETKFFSTGLRSAFSDKFWVEIKERGSTGSIGLSVRSGVIDSGYRGEWKIILTNVNKFPIEFSDKVHRTTCIFSKIFKNKIKKIIYPLSKAIAQAVFISLPDVQSEEWDEEKVAASERGDSGGGASGK